MITPPIGQASFVAYDRPPSYAPPYRFTGTENLSDGNGSRTVAIHQRDGSPNRYASETFSGSRWKGAARVPCTQYRSTVLSKSGSKNKSVPPKVLKPEVVSLAFKSDVELASLSAEPVSVDEPRPYNRDGGKYQGGDVYCRGKVSSFEDFALAKNPEISFQDDTSVSDLYPEDKEADFSDDKGIESFRDILFDAMKNGPSPGLTSYLKQPEEIEEMMERSDFKERFGFSSSDVGRILLKKISRRFVSSEQIFKAKQEVRDTYRGESLWLLDLIARSEHLSSQEKKLKYKFLQKRNAFENLVYLQASGLVMAEVFWQPDTSRISFKDELKNADANLQQACIFRSGGGYMYGLSMHDPLGIKVHFARKRLDPTY